MTLNENETLKLGIIGPCDIKRAANAIGISLDEYKLFLRRIGEVLANLNVELIICPEEGSVTLCAENYKKHKGKCIFGIVPKSEKEDCTYKFKWNLCDKYIFVSDWVHQPVELIKSSDIVIVLGIARGTLIEICYAGLYPPKHVLIFPQLLSKPLHDELFIPTLRYIHTLEELSSIVNYTGVSALLYKTESKDIFV